jgi:hypothetical protein
MGNTAYVLAAGAFILVLVVALVAMIVGFTGDVVEHVTFLLVSQLVPSGLRYRTSGEAGRARLANL